MIDVLIRNLNDAFGYGVWVYDKNEATGQIKILSLLGSYEWKEFKMGEMLPKPLLSTSTREGDIIFDKFIERLKEAGYGKNQLSIESGELKAMKDHLADMKKLVFTPPAHLLAPIIISGENRQSLPGGPFFPGRVSYSTPDDIKIDRGRLRMAARKCANAEAVLKEIFPEVFGMGWRNETD